MGRFLQAILVQDEAQSADGITTFDLPINPLSHILVTIKAANNNPLATHEDYNVLANLLAMVTRLEILNRGSAIVAGSLTDLAVISMLLRGKELYQSQIDDVDNNIRAVTVPIPLGRKLYDEAECFPATRRGEMSLQLTSDVAVTGLDTLIYQIETVELLDARPQGHLRYNTLSKTPSATGEDDLDLPIGNRLLSALLFGTTVPTGAVYTASIDDVQFFINSVGAFYQRTNWETLHGMLGQRLGPLVNNDHAHTIAVVDSGQAAANVLSKDGTTFAFESSASDTEELITPGSISGAMRQTLVNSLIENYALLDFDPNNDGAFAPDTLGASRVHMRIDHGAADAIRVLPIELVRV